jgi:hypothetical protein
MIRKEKNPEEEKMKAKLIKKVFQLASISDIINKDTKEDRAENTAILNSYLLKENVTKTPLQQQNIKQLERTIHHFESLFFKDSISNAIQRSEILLTIWEEEWVKREEYEKAQICKDYRNRVKKEPMLAFSVLEHERRYMKITNL